jgi:hypothetical protein
MGPEFMRIAIASADIRGQEKIVRREFGPHLPAVSGALYFWPNGVGFTLSRACLTAPRLGRALPRGAWTAGKPQFVMIIGYFIFWKRIACYYFQA